MSEAFRGVEVHGNQVILPDMTMPFAIGTRHDPVTQAEVMEAVIQGWVRSAAIGEGWDIHGGHFGVYVGADRTGNAVGVEGRVYVEDGVTMSGHIYGMDSRAYVLDGGITVAGATLEGLHIAVNVEGGATIGSDVYGMYIQNYVRVHTFSYDFIRLEENAPEANVRSVISCFVGSGDIGYYTYLPAIENAWSDAEDKATTGTALGWLRCCVNGKVRYIQLYQPAGGEETPDSGDSDIIA